MTSVFDLYGYGSPQYGGDSIDASTADVAALYDQQQRYGNSLFGRIDNFLRSKQSQPNQLASDASLWDQAAEAGNRLAHMPVDMLLAGSRTANNWAGSPQFPERVETGDMLAPLGLGAMAGLGGALKGAARQGRMMPDTIPASYFDDIMPAAGAGRAATDLTVPQNRLVRAANDGDDGPLRGNYPAPGNLPLRPSEASSVSLTEAYERYAEKAFQRGLQPDSFERFREAVIDAGIVTQRQAGRSVLPGVELFADQSRASLPGIAANALDMSHEARMQRAKEMGFDTENVWYHGTRSNFPEFDLGLANSSSNTGVPGAVVFTDSPKNASTYASTKVGVWGDRHQYDAGANVVPTNHRYLHDLHVDARGNNWNEIEYNGRFYDINELAEMAKQMEYDGLTVSNVVDTKDMYGAPEPATTRFVFDPRNIRSVNAAFDPAKRDSANLLAADQSRASLPGMAANALDMSHEARMQRANEMGFHPETFYHGTAGAFSEFDLTRGGQVSGSRAGSTGVSIAPGPEVANEFAAIAQGKGGDPSVMPLRARLGRAGAVTLDGTEKNLEVAATLAEMFGAGYDTAVLKNYTTPGGGKGNTVLVVRDPSQLRSVNAAFDPAKRDSANLLAADQSRASLPGLFAGAVDEPRGITAYHGSPHDFDRFDMSKIGTGEGAQAYGHGLYFAENEGVARSYRDALKHNVINLDGLPTSRELAIDELSNRIRDAVPGASQPYNAAKMLTGWIAEGATPQQIIQRINAGAWQPELKAELGLVADALHNHVTGNSGRMYQVRINAAPEDFLDWDKPLSQQSDKVRGALSTAYADDPVRSADIAYGNGSSTPAYIMRNAHGPEVSKTLREAGVPGIKYLDQGSRFAGDGSRNYVLFRDDIIEIVKKYGIAAAASMYGMSAVDEAMASEGP